jgi:hypothetical protein
LTVPAVSRALRAWAAPHRARLLRELWGNGRRGWEAGFLPPVWLLAEAWPALAGWQRLHAVVRAVFLADIDVLAWVKRRGGCGGGGDGCRGEGAGCGGERGCGGQEEGGVFSDAQLCMTAALTGCLEVLVWLREEAGCPWNEMVPLYAAAGGHVRVLAYAVEAGCPWRPAACLQ